MLEEDKSSTPSANRRLDMRFLYGVSTVLAASMLQGAAAAAAAAQQSNGLSLTDAISQMPTCAVCNHHLDGAILNMG